MAWLAVNKDGSEYVYASCPERGERFFGYEGNRYYVGLPKVTIKKIIGRELTWQDEPVEIK